MIKLKEGIQLAPGIITFDNVIDNSQSLINIANTINEWKEPKIGGDEGPVVDKEARNCEVISLHTSFKNPKEWFELAQIIWSYGNDYSRNFYVAFSNMEILQMIKYNPNDNFYKPHADAGPDFPRCISAILYLNTVHEGGETYFDKFDVSVKPEAGKLLLFPSNFIYTHEGKPPVNQTKYIIATWFDQIITGFNDG